MTVLKKAFSECVTPTYPYRIRSYVARGRLSDAKARACQELQPLFGLHVEAGRIEYHQVFGRDSETKRYLEIGFGAGHSLLHLAKAAPDCDFIGVETHKPGIGALCQGIALLGLTNVRFYHHDVVDVVEKCIPDASLDAIQLFFPDPWPKRRHHPRRLVQPEFVALAASKLKMGGELHLATDWEDYAKYMMQVVSAQPVLINLTGVQQYSACRSHLRPILTRFESKALHEGRRFDVWITATNDRRCVERPRNRSRIQANACFVVPIDYRT